MKKNNVSKVVPKVSGNTILKPATQTEPHDAYTKGRAWCLTIYDENELINLKDKIIRYYIYGIEICPSTGRTHYQTFIYTHQSVRFTALKELFKTAHIEKKLKISTNEQAIDYCKKDNNYTEEGKPPKQGKHQIDTDTLKNMTDIEIIEEVPIKEVKSWINARDILNSNMNIKDWNKKITVYYIQGPSGSGKSTWIENFIQTLPEEYHEVNLIKHVNNFWLGIGNAKVAIYDDFRDSHMKASEFINFIDYRRHKLNCKNRDHVTNNYEYIFISSVQNITDIYANMNIIDNEPSKQWIRRCITIDLNNNNIPIDTIKE